MTVFKDSAVRPRRPAAVRSGAHDLSMSTTKPPQIASVAGKVKAKQALLDGEVPVLLPSGKSTFHGLQEALSGSDPAIDYSCRHCQ